MSEYATIVHYTNHVMSEITTRDVEQISERLRELGWEKIVRCRDCECFDEETRLCNRLGKFPEWHACTEPDGFCKWGER